MRRKLAQEIRSKGFGYCYWRYGLVGLALPLTVFAPLAWVAKEPSWEVYLRALAFHVLLTPIVALGYSWLMWYHASNSDIGADS